MMDVFEQEMQEIFPHNPLQQVALEIRYPPDLTILSSILPNFQKRVRERYPQYAMGPVITLPAGTTSNEATFQSANGERQLRLSDYHLVIIFARYTTFRDFMAEALSVIGVLDELVELGTLQRVGLRYINNIIIQERDHDVKDVVHPFVDMTQLPAGTLRQFVSTVNIVREGYSLNVTTAQLPPTGSSQPMNGDAQPRAIYVLDIDCFTDEPKIVRDPSDLLPVFRREIKAIFLTHVTDSYKQRMRGVQ